MWLPFPPDAGATLARLIPADHDARTALFIGSVFILFLPWLARRSAASWTDTDTDTDME